MPGVAAHLTVSIDFDHCTDSEPKRLALIAALKEYLQANPRIQSVEILIGSYRQSLLQDFHAAYVNKHQRNDETYVSCKVLGQAFIDQLTESCQGLSVKIAFNPLLAGDVYAQLPLGTSFRQMCKIDYNDLADRVKNHHVCAIANVNDQTKSIFAIEANGHYNSGSSLFCPDTSKTLLLYMQMHAAAMIQQQAFDFLFIDDSPKILSSLLYFFNRYPELLPKACCFSAWRFQDAKTQEVYASIGGTGVINQLWQEDLRAVAQQLNELVMEKHQRTGINSELAPIVIQQVLCERVYSYHIANEMIVSTQEVLLKAFELAYKNPDPDEKTAYYQTVVNKLLDANVTIGARDVEKILLTISRYLMSGRFCLPLDLEEASIEAPQENMPISLLMTVERLLAKDHLAAIMLEGVDDAEYDFEKSQIKASFSDWLQCLVCQSLECPQGSKAWQQYNTQQLMNLVCEQRGALSYPPVFAERLSGPPSISASVPPGVAGSGGLVSQGQTKPCYQGGSRQSPNTVTFLVEIGLYKERLKNSV